LTKVAPDVMYAYTNGLVTYHTNGTTHQRDATNLVWVTNYYYSFVTNATFYDYREGDTVKAIQIDVDKLGDWLGNTATNYGTTSTGGWQYEQKNADGSTTDEGHVINSIYVFNSIARTASVLPALRLIHGEQLPTNACGTYKASGLGVATAMPIYVEGNYNVTRNNANFAYTLGSTTNGCSLPACLIGDAVTIISSNFTDYASGSLPNSQNPNPSQNIITLNAACFEGIVPSNGSYYSGGLENFLRLLENWGSKTVTYNGSIVVMFPSVYATNHWGGGYYTAPSRSWGFDTTFSQPGGLPPLCPSLKGNARATWHYY
jgi:hypothetical protein